jgi:hypothetical protein
MLDGLEEATSDAAVSSGTESPATEGLTMITDVLTTIFESVIATTSESLDLTAETTTTIVTIEEGILTTENPPSTTSRSATALGEIAENAATSTEETSAITESIGVPNGSDPTTMEGEVTTIIFLLSTTDTTEATVEEIETTVGKVFTSTTGISLTIHLQYALKYLPYIFYKVNSSC